MDERIRALRQQLDAVAYFFSLGPLIGLLIYVASMGRPGPEIILTLPFAILFAYCLGAVPALLSGACFAMLGSHARKPFVIMACAAVGGLGAYFFSAPFTIPIAVLSGAVTAGFRFIRDLKDSPIRPSQLG